MVENYIKYCILFHSLWGFHDFTHSLYIHYILLNLSVFLLCLRINYLVCLPGLAWLLCLGLILLGPEKWKPWFIKLVWMLSLEMLYTYIVHDCDIVYIWYTCIYAMVSIGCMCLSLPGFPNSSNLALFRHIILQ